MENYYNPKYRPNNTNNENEPKKKTRKPFQTRNKIIFQTSTEKQRSKTEKEWVLALSRNDTQVVKSQLAENPSLAVRVDHLTGQAAIHWAVKYNNIDLINQLILEYNVHPDMLSKGGYTPLHLAGIYGRRELYNILRDKHGSNELARDYAGKTPEHYLITVQYKDVYGPNCTGINKVWHQLANDYQDTFSW